MESGRPIIEGNRARADMHHLRLMALLQELERNHGRKRAAAILGVDRRTLDAGLDERVLSRRMRGALDKALQAGVGSATAEQRDRTGRLEEELQEVKGQVEALAEDVSKGFAAVQGDGKALRDEQAQLRRWVAALEGGGDAQAPGDGAHSEGEPAKRRPAPWREYPDLITREPADGDEEVFGGAWPLIAEWRELKDAHPVRGKGFEWLTDEESLLVMELTLLEEHDMTLPPEKQPLRDFARNGQINWRRTALSDTRRALRKRELLVRVGRVVTLGLWRR